MMTCDTCKTENRAIAIYCKRCGTKQKTTAPPAAAPKPADNFAELIGLEELKTKLSRQITAIVSAKKAGFFFDIRSISTMLIGDTGTGKSKVAELVARVLHQQGLIKHKELVVVPAANFMEFSRNLSASLDAKKGSMVLIDHVHQLVPSGYIPGQPTPMDKLYAELDARKGDPVVFIASKAEGFEDYLRANPDVNNRFHFKFYLPALSLLQMTALAEQQLQKGNFELEEAFLPKLKQRMHFLFRQQHGGAEAANAGRGGFLVQKELQHIITEHFSGEAHLTAPKLLLAEDIKGPLYVSRTVEDVLAELDTFAGMSAVKEFIRNLMDLVAIGKQDAALNSGTEELGVHMVITGNPGTGKTTLARKLGEIFAAAELLPSGHVVEVDRSKLVGKYIGETPQLVQKYCDEAMGGILYIDEAYDLVKDDQDQYGREAINTLMKRMEDDRGEFMMIATGYQFEMQQFINANPGMKSRVGKNFFHLEDYQPEELLAILKGLLDKGGYELQDAAEQKAAKLLTEKYRQRSRGFGNGREVRNLYDEILLQRSARLRNNPGGIHDLCIYESDIPGEEADLSAESLSGVLKALNAMTGLEAVKNKVARLIDRMEGRRIREGQGMEQQNDGDHFVFAGSPGTGKTTVARLMAKIFKAMGILPTDKLIEVTDKDLIGDHVGKTSKLTSSFIEAAMGGVLYIDEAYTLTSSNSVYGSEAIATLLKRMEDDRGKFIVIASGYSKEMDAFMGSNPGLDSRFSETIVFEDYGPEELYDIMLGMLNKGGFTLDEAVPVKLKAYLKELHQHKTDRFANARTVRNEFKAIIDRQSARITRLKRNSEDFVASLITVSDLGLAPEAETPEENISRAMAALNNLVGLESVKAELDELISYVKMQKRRKELSGDPENKLNLHFIFKGNPGTGKTTVARLLGQIFKSLGILEQGQLIETSRKDLVGQYRGHTAKQTSDVIDTAIGGILFIDEAYTLVPEGDQDPFGKEALETLLIRMENDRGKFIVIAAGYSGDMDRFVAANDGLASRFPREIIFEDYDARAMTAIFRNLVKAEGMTLSEGTPELLESYFDELYQSRDSKFANGRTVRNLFERALPRQAQRLTRLEREGQDIQSQLKEIDIKDIDF